MTGNDFVAWILRSPFHRLFSSGTMLITVTGRKTGRKYTTPVGYYRKNEFLWVLTSRDRTWWRNLQEGGQVDLLLKRKPVHAFAETELDQKAVETQMADYIRHVPQSAKPLGIHVKHGVVDMVDVANAARGRLFIKISFS